MKRYRISIRYDASMFNGVAIASVAYITDFGGIHHHFVPYHTIFEYYAIAHREAKRQGRCDEFRSYLKRTARFPVLQAISTWGHE